MSTTNLALLLSGWTTNLLPTQTTLTHIDPTHISGVVETLYSLLSSYPTVTNRLELYHMLRDAQGAMASLRVISAQNYIATATDTQRLPEMTQIIWNSTMQLQELEMGFNLYQMQLSLAPNLAFALVFAFVLLFHVALGVWRKHVYFSVCMSIGVALEGAGYVARILSIGDYSDKHTFLCQIITLTLAPAFVMAGVYFLLAQLLIVHGRRFSVLRPLWFSYIFIFCDVSSLAIQAGGGGTAAIKLQNLESTATGTHVMVSGIAFQVLSMLLFLVLMANFLYRIYFAASSEVKCLVLNFGRLLFQTKKGREMMQTHLQPHYNQKYAHIWSRRRFAYYPLVLILLVFFIYVRCVYRLVELSEGWSGYLITHEIYVMTLDALMVLVTCVLLIPFHPGFMMGANTNISVAQIKHEEDLETASMKLRSSARSFDSFPLEEKVDPFRVSERLVSSSECSAASSPQVNAREVSSPVLGSFQAFLPSIHDATNDSDFVSVPYETTTSTPRMSMSDVKRSSRMHEKPTKTHKKTVKTHRGSDAPIFNPYERNLTHGNALSDRLATSGPYEQYYGDHHRNNQVANPFEDQFEENYTNPFETPHHNSDAMSQVSNDEDFFEFK